MSDYHNLPKSPQFSKWERLRMRFFRYLSPGYCKWRVKEIWDYVVGEHWCSRRHYPLFHEIGGSGGRDVFGRKRRDYWGLWCSTCGRRWETTRAPKPQTRQQEKVLSEVFGTMWAGEDGSFSVRDVTEEDVVAVITKLSKTLDDGSRFCPEEIISVCWNRLREIEHEDRIRYSKFHQRRAYDCVEGTTNTNNNDDVKG